MTTLLKFISERHYQHNDIDDYAREYVETMESGNGEKVIGKIG
jgi:dephospho-CoA kinase